MSGRSQLPQFSQLGHAMRGISAFHKLPLGSLQSPSLLFPPKSVLEKIPAVDVDFTLDAELARMITAGETATQYIVLACELLTPHDLGLEIDPLIFSYFEDCCDERVAIDFSQIPTTHQAALYRALEKSDGCQGIGFGFPRLHGHQEHKDQVVPINGCPLQQLAWHLLSKLPAHAFPGGMIDIKFSMDLGL